VPLLSGKTVQHRALEAEMSRLTRTTGSILFTSGYAGALGLCSALLRRGDVAVLDELAHMSWMDGARMAGATLARFAHNDPAALDEQLTRHAGRRRMVVVDGLYSMDGDLADLPGLLDVADAHGVGIVVDEAHAMFAMGPQGGGATAHFGEQARVRVLFGTFSKALSMVGAFASADAGLLEYVRYYAHPYVFSAALPPATVAGITAAVRAVAVADALRERLADNARYFRDGLRALGLDTGASQSHIVPVILGSDRRLLYQGVRELMLRGLFVAPVDYPAVPADRVRFRCAVSAGHTLADLDQALELIAEIFAPARLAT
jgi:glycine C-acetyltransferase